MPPVRHALAVYAVAGCGQDRRFVLEPVGATGRLITDPCLDSAAAVRTLADPMWLAGVLFLGRGLDFQCDGVGRFLSTLRTVLGDCLPRLWSDTIGHGWWTLREQGP